MTLVAHRERARSDPETGAPGVLRDEWEVREVADFASSELEAAWGPDWRRYKPFASHVLVHRYIRRGVVESWKPFDSANSYEQAFEHVDSEAIPLAPELIALQTRRREAREAEKAAAEAKRQAQWAADRAAQQKKLSEEAFKRLAASKDSAWATRFNRYCTAHVGDTAFLERARSDERFVALHQAVQDAVTVPSKRKAIREFLTYAERRK